MLPGLISRAAMETMAANGGGKGRAAARYGDREQQGAGCGGARRFQMPLHYPKYTRANYEAMPEWQLDRLLSDYGLPVHGSVNQKRSFAIGAFLWGAGN